MRRRGHLAEFEILLVVALVVSGLGALYFGWELVTRAPVIATVNTVPAVPGLAPGVHPDPDGQVVVIVEEPSWAQVAWEAVGAAPWGLLIVFTLVMLLRVVRTARRGDPFSVANTQRLALTGWVLLVGSAVACAVEFVAAAELAARVRTTDAVSGSATFSFIGAFAGLGFLAVGEVLKRGRELQSELAEVI